MMLKSRNKLNQKSKLKSMLRKLKKKRSKLRLKRHQPRLKMLRMLRHQPPKSRHQRQPLSKRTMLTKIHTMKKNTHLRMTKPL